jgi:hypothetical protein
VSAEPVALAHDAVHRWVEATTMALYVSIALLAALAAVHPESATRQHTLVLIWGTTLGLAVAHYVAFRLASHVARGRELSRHDVAIAGVQLIGALLVPLVCTITEVLFADDDDAIDVAEFTIAGVLGVTGYLSARGNGASRGRAALLGAGVLVAGLVTAALKYALTSGH